MQIPLEVSVMGEKRARTIDANEIQSITTLDTHWDGPNEIEVEMKNGARYVVLERNEATLKKRIEEAKKKAGR